MTPQEEFDRELLKIKNAQRNKKPSSEIPIPVLLIIRGLVTLAYPQATAETMRKVHYVLFFFLVLVFIACLFFAFRR